MAQNSSVKKIVRRSCALTAATPPPPENHAPSEVVPLHQPRCPEKGATSALGVGGYATSVSFVCVLYVFCVVFVWFLCGLFAICVVFYGLWKRCCYLFKCKYCEKPSAWNDMNPTAGNMSTYEKSWPVLKPWEQYHEDTLDGSEIPRPTTVWMYKTLQVMG